MHIIGNRQFNPLLQYMPLYRWSSQYAIETDQIENVFKPFIQKVCAQYINDCAALIFPAPRISTPI